MSARLSPASKSSVTPRTSLHIPLASAVVYMNVLQAQRRLATVVFGILMPGKVWVLGHGRFAGGGAMVSGRYSLERRRGLKTSSKERVMEMIASCRMAMAIMGDMIYQTLSL